jgi:hypothetical protein
VEESGMIKYLVAQEMIESGEAKGMTKYLVAQEMMK